MGNRLAVLLASTLFIVLAGTGVSNALWSTSGSVGAGASAVSLDANCTSITSLVGGGFESPVLTGSVETRPSVPGWTTSNASAVTLRTGGTPPAVEGNQYVDLGAPTVLYQDIATTPGQALRWSLLQRSASTQTTLSVSIGAPGSNAFDTRPAVGSSSWQRHSGTYDVPTGQSVTRFSIRIVASASNPGARSYVDDVSFGTGPCVELTSTSKNMTRSSGAAESGDVIEYVTTARNVGGGPAVETRLRAPVPVSTSLQPDSFRLTMGSTTSSPTAAVDDDRAEYNLERDSVIARLGEVSAADRALAPGATTSFAFRVVVSVSATTSTLQFAPVLNYLDALTRWPMTATPPPLENAVVTGADLGVTTVADTPAPPPGGPAAQWSVTVANRGPLSGMSVRLGVTVPVQLSDVQVSRNGQACTSTGPVTFTCDIDTLAAGFTTTVTVLGSVPDAVPPGTALTVTATVQSATSDPKPADDTAAATAIVTSDPTAPTMPGRPQVTATNSDSITFGWAASTDDVGVTEYEVYRDSVLIATVPGTTTGYTDTGLVADTSYRYAIVAGDADGERSPRTAATTAQPFQLEAAANYQITHTATGKCVGPGYERGIDLEGDQAFLVQAPCADSFEFTTVDGSTYQIAYAPEKPLSQDTLVLAHTGAFGTAVTFEKATAGLAAQQWTLRYLPDGGYAFGHGATGRCLHAGAADTEGELGLILEPCAPVAAQTFGLEPR